MRGFYPALTYEPGASEALSNLQPLLSREQDQTQVLLLESDSGSIQGKGSKLEMGSKGSIRALSCAITMFSPLTDMRVSILKYSQ